MELEDSLEDKVADGFDEREEVIIGKNFGGITDLEVGPDGNLYVLSFHRSQGTIFRIESTENTSNGFDSTTSPDALVPSWVKNNAAWWADNQIDDGTFVEGIKFLIKEEIIIVPATETTSETEVNVPSWIKQSAKWWADGIVTDAEFLNSIQYMISTGIITLD